MYSTSQFGYNPTLCNMFAEASSFPRGTIVGTRQFQVESAHTGRVMTFNLYEVDRGISGNILAWHYKPAAGEMPCNVKNLYIWND